MTDDEDPWRPTERSRHGPSAPTDPRFDPLATGIGVFSAVAIPIFVLGYTRPAGASGTIIGVGIALGLLAGLLVGLWIARREGRVWRGPRL